MKMAYMVLKRGPDFHNRMSDKCAKTFCHKGNLKDHMIRHHGQTTTGLPHISKNTALLKVPRNIHGSLQKTDQNMLRQANNVLIYISVVESWPWNNTGKQSSCKQDHNQKFKRKTLNELNDNHIEIIKRLKVGDKLV